jgi:hypothetical protein
VTASHPTFIKIERYLRTGEHPDPAFTRLIRIGHCFRVEYFLWFSQKEVAMTDTNHGILGIDISKAKFDVALMVAGKVKKTHVFENAPEGFKVL